MECALRWGIVLVVRNFPGRQELEVSLDGRSSGAINYPGLTGPCQPGDKVLLNTTARELELGTGGWHYVLAVSGRERSLSTQGHIMKLRYTPLQGRVLSVEEEASPHHQIMAAADCLEGLPVAVGSLHSLLAPLAWGVRALKGGKRLAYLMSDGAALPIFFSQTVPVLKDMGLITRTITFGHAFGGDLEAVNIYSALLAAKHVVGADFALVTMGPGVVGTGTAWGTTALEQGIFLNAVHQLGGTPVVVPRLSEGDGRKRHAGLSHHTATVLSRIVRDPIWLPLPLYFEPFLAPEHEGLFARHRLRWEDTHDLFLGLADSGLPLSTMGRGVNADPLFFHGALAAALTLTANL